jgi:hypothetical protein
MPFGDERREEIFKKAYQGQTDHDAVASGITPSHVQTGPPAIAHIKIVTPKINRMLRSMVPTFFFIPSP